ncbi:ferredoxin [Sphaerimonospora cavernae]|uniref:Ferredoxin n=1 Tax=Sphaerimonospora cavernae TaxID=1740611 RepID=A0ABV6UBH0_9ACTN
MRIDVDMNLCESHGQCVFAAPDVFSFDDEDTLTYTAVVDDTRRDAVARAAATCPVRAILIADNNAVS